MKKKVAAAVAVAVVVVAGAGAGVRYATDDPARCAKPITILGSEQTESIRALEEYISANIAPTFKHPENLSWESDDFDPTVLPGRISARIAVVDAMSGTARYYHVTVTRDCQGGDWKVVEFKRLPK